MKRYGAAWIGCLGFGWELSRVWVEKVPLGCQRVVHEALGSGAVPPPIQTLAVGERSNLGDCASSNSTLSHSELSFSRCYLYVDYAQMASALRS